MESFEDQGIVLSVRAHGEHGAVVALLTQSHGRYLGFVNGAKSSRMRGMLEIGSVVDVSWRARTSDQMGAWTIDHAQSTAAYIMADPLRLSALLSACALVDAALPERESHPALFEGMKALMQTLHMDVWAQAYILWEIALLRELGFGLDFSRCVAGGDAATLAYISPKSGCAVSLKEGEPYRHKLLVLPEFLKPNGYRDTQEIDIIRGLEMTGHFLEHWVFAHATRGVPDARLRFYTSFATTHTCQALA
jgi:DNA repair protein RecO (recombination protein O)